MEEASTGDSISTAQGRQIINGLLHRVQDLEHEHEEDKRQIEELRQHQQYLQPIQNITVNAHQVIQTPQLIQQNNDRPVSPLILTSSPGDCCVWGMMGYPRTGVPQMTQTCNSMLLTPEQASYFASSPPQRRHSTSGMSFSPGSLGCPQMMNEQVAAATRLQMMASASNQLQMSQGFQFPTSPDIDATFRKQPFYQGNETFLKSYNGAQQHLGVEQPTSCRFQLEQDHKLHHAHKRPTSGTIDYDDNDGSQGYHDITCRKQLYSPNTSHHGNDNTGIHGNDDTGNHDDLGNGHQNYAQADDTGILESGTDRVTEDMAQRSPQMDKIHYVHDADDLTHFSGESTGNFEHYQQPTRDLQQTERQGNVDHIILEHTADRQTVPKSCCCGMCEIRPCDAENICCHRKKCITLSVEFIDSVFRDNNESKLQVYCRASHFGYIPLNMKKIIPLPSCVVAAIHRHCPQPDTVNDEKFRSSENIPKVAAVYAAHIP